MVGSKVPIEGLLVLGRIHDRNFGDNMKIGSKSKNSGKFCNYCKKKRHTKSDCYKFQNKNKIVVTYQKEKQLENSDEASLIEDSYNDGELLTIFNADSKPCEDWILDSV